MSENRYGTGRTNHVPVLIVGGGPIGLALAADLGRRNVPVRLIERGEDKLGSAKMIVVSMRTMEICRHMGIDGPVRDWGFPLDLPLDSVFCTALTGHELGRVASPSLLTESVTPFSPERERPCPQTWFDPILQTFARGFPHVALDYNTALVDFAQYPDCVEARVSGPDGTIEKITADYLVGCDGFSSTVREQLGIELRGNKHLDRSMSIYVRSSELWQVHDLGPAYRYCIVGPQGTWSILTTIDGKDLWRIQLVGAAPEDRASLDVEAILQRMVGRKVDFVLEDISGWVRKMTIADRFADGRVFLAGDSAHAHPPNGGLGMNTGIQDSWDLGWKIAAVHHGWGGPHLLESYDWERRPAASRAAGESLQNYFRLTGTEDEPDLLAETPEGAVARSRLGERLVEENEKAWHPIGVHIGYVYQPSPIVIADDEPAGEDDCVGHVPSARPGARAPHVVLNDGRSILDLFGGGFVLLDFDTGDRSPLTEAAAMRSVPLQHVALAAERTARELYRGALVLVRPDGHVAWRGDALPEDCLALIDRVRGAADGIACRPKGL